MNVAEILSKTYLFKNFTQEELRTIAAIADEQKLAAHAELFREGDEGGAMYVIALGTMRVLKRNKSGDDEEVALLGTGSYFGEMALVSDDHQRSASMAAAEPTTLIVLARNAIERLCAQNHTLAFHFYQALSRGLAKRLAATTQDAAEYRAMWKARR